MFKRTLNCLSVSVEDLNLQYRYEEKNTLGTTYFDLLNSALVAW